MTSFTIFHGPYDFTTYGGGVAVLLRKGDHTIHWQGDEASAIADRFDAEGFDALDAIWDEYESVAQHDPA